MRIASGFFALALLLCCASCKHDSSTFQAGVGVATMDVPSGAPLAGYIGSERRLDSPDLNPLNYHTFFKPSEGTHDPVRAKALVLTKGSSTLVLVRLDTVMVTVNLCNDLLKAISKIHGVPKSHILLAATHNHSGPGCFSDRLYLQVGGLDVFHPVVTAKIKAAALEAVAKAFLSRVDAKIGFGSGATTGLVVNRRDDPWLDPTATVMRVDKASGGPLALLFHMAVHGNAVGPENLLVTADVPGYAEAALGSLTGAEALFFNGAEGDVDPVVAEETIAEAEPWGPACAAQVHAIWSSVSTSTEFTLAASRHTTKLPDPFVKTTIPSLAPDIATFLSALAGAAHFFGMSASPELLPLKGLMDQAFSFQAIRLNDRLIVTVPGEPTTPVGMQLKEIALAKGYPNTLVFGVANGYMGYVVSAEQHEAGGYETALTLFGPETDDLVAAEAGKAIDALPVGE